MSFDRLEPTLTYADIQQVLDSVRYKDLELDFDSLPDKDGIRIRMWYRTTCVITGTANLLLVTAMDLYDRSISKRQLLKDIRKFVRDLVLHEFDEHFMVDGEHYVEPHPRSEVTEPKWLLYQYEKSKGEHSTFGQYALPSEASKEEEPKQPSELP